MTPPELDVDACQQKLMLLSDLLSDLDRHGDPTGAQLRTDRDLRHIIERVLTQLVDITVATNSLLARAQGLRRPGGYRDSFLLLADAGVLPAELMDRLAPSAGMRNLLTHEYGRIDHDLVAAAVPRARADFRAYVEAVAQLLAEEEGSGPGGR